MDLVDEQHVALLEVREDGGEVARTLQRRAGRRTEPHAHRVRHDPGQRGLSQPGRPGEQQMVDDVAARTSSLDQEPELFLDPFLSHELGE